MKAVRAAAAGRAEKGKAKAYSAEPPSRRGYTRVAFWLEDETLAMVDSLVASENAGRPPGSTPETRVGIVRQALHVMRQQQAGSK